MKELLKGSMDNFGMAVEIQRPTVYATTARIGQQKLNDGAKLPSRKSRFPLDAALQAGEVVKELVNSTYYLTLRTAFRVINRVNCETVALLVTANDTVTVKRLTTTYDGYGNPSGKTWADTATNVRGNPEWISGRQRQEDPGILPTTVLRFYLPGTTTVSEVGTEGPDRVVYGGANYQVNAVDGISMPGVKIVQLATDTRS